MPDLIKQVRPMHVEDVWLEGADAPPSLAARVAVVALVLGVVFAAFFAIGHATAGGGAQSELPAGTVVGAGQAAVPAGLKGVAALGPLTAPQPKVVAPPATSTPVSGTGETESSSSRQATQATGAETSAPAVPAPAQPTPKPTPAPSKTGGHSEHSSGGGSFDSSG